MTVSSQTSNETFFGNGVTTTWPLPFRFFQNSDIQASLVDPATQTSTPLVLGTDYTLTGAGLPEQFGTAPGTITTVVPVANGKELYVERVMDVEQLTDIINQGEFFPEIHEDVFDRLTMLIQQNAAGLGRALMRPPGKNYYDAEGRQIKNLADPTQDQDAATVRWATDFIAGILQTGQGPVNNAANVIFVDGDNDVTTVQKGVIKQFRDISKLRLKAGDKDREQATVLGYYSTTPGVGGGRVYWDAASTEADNDGTVFAVTGVATGRWKRPRKGGVWAEHFGVRNDGDTAYRTDNTDRLLAAIQSMRADPSDRIQYIGGPTVTAYTTGIVNFGNGKFALEFDRLDFTQDTGLTFLGQGSRGHGGFRANTTLLFSGTSSGFAFRWMGNGARRACISNLDISYLDANFTGDLIDLITCPGIRLHEVNLGCYGNTVATRVFTARSLVRASFDEMVLFDRVVFDSGVDGWWSDDTRTLGSLTFGGSITRFRDCHFYDLTGSMVRHDGNRTRQGLMLDNCAFNPINQVPVCGLNVNNVEGLEVIGLFSGPSVAGNPTDGHIKVINCTGNIQGLEFNLGKIGTISGYLTLTGSRFACDNGLTISGGVVTAYGNEFRSGAHGYIVQPAITLAVDIGPDIFLPSVTTSYYVPADSTLLSGKINYNFNNDSSTSKLFNASTRITFRNLDEQIATIATLPANGSALFSGRTYNCTAAGTFTLPTPILGSKIRVMKSTATALVIAAAPSTNFLVGASAARTTATSTTAELGSCVEFEAISTTTWLASVIRGTWSFT